MRKILMVLLMLIMLVSLTGCKEETIDYNLDGYYNGDLVCQHVAISSWVTGFNIEIKENVLFIDELEKIVSDNTDKFSETTFVSSQKDAEEMEFWLAESHTKIELEHYVVFKPSQITNTQ